MITQGRRLKIHIYLPEVVTHNIRKSHKNIYTRTKQITDTKVNASYASVML